MLNFTLNGTVAAANKLFQSGNTYILNYPCESVSECYPYEVTLPPALYKIELYGASGGYSEELRTDGCTVSTAHDPDTDECYQDNVSLFNGNTECETGGSLPGAGAYTAATLLLTKRTKAFIHIGGQGTYNTAFYTSYDMQYRAKGGYNGGGHSAAYYDHITAYGCSSGGGATDVRLNIDDLWHRIIVSGGGGGADNVKTDVIRGDDDGSGGAGGGPSAQGFWINGEYYGQWIANQTEGFTFGTGESGNENSNSPKGRSGTGVSDRAGGGGGWFGGYSSNHGNGGAGGGSSFVFTKNTEMPSNPIEARDSFYENNVSNDYGFQYPTFFSLTNPIFVTGIWKGSGKAIITYISSYPPTQPIKLRSISRMQDLMF